MTIGQQRAEALTRFLDENAELFGVTAEEMDDEEEMDDATPSVPSGAVLIIRRTSFDTDGHPIERIATVPTLGLGYCTRIGMIAWAAQQ